jgi:pyruvate/2-oxoglutarate dehydrogenase complex dihydrolipoamide acyltransferase (E2) component
LSKTIEIKVPDIGDFSDVPVIEVLVSAGDRVKAEDGLITLESDKATMEVPSPEDGVITEVRLQVDDTVSEGDVVAILEVGEAEADAGADSAEAEAQEGNAEAGPADRPDEPDAEKAPEATQPEAAARARGRPGSRRSIHRACRTPAPQSAGSPGNSASTSRGSAAAATRGASCVTT